MNICTIYKYTYVCTHDYSKTQHALLIVFSWLHVLLNVSFFSSLLWISLSTLHTLEQFNLLEHTLLHFFIKFLIRCFIWFSVRCFVPKNHLYVTSIHKHIVSAHTLLSRGENNKNNNNTFFISKIFMSFNVRLEFVWNRIRSREKLAKHNCISYECDIIKMDIIRLSIEQ